MENEYELSPEERGVVETYLRPMGQIREQMAAALRMVVAQQHLDGDWTLNDDGTKLVRRSQ